MHARRALCKCPDRSETVFIRFLMIDTTSDQDLRSITQKLRPYRAFFDQIACGGIQTCGRIIGRLNEGHATNFNRFRHKR